MGKSMTIKPVPVPNLLSEMFMSMLKVFCFIIVIIIVLNNVLWVYYVSKPTTPRIGDTHVEITQTGNKNIKQNINP